MADNKKYYYLKLKENFFDSDEIIILESMENGYLYSNILLKLYLRSLKNEGKLMFNDRIPFNTKMLAQVTRHSENEIENALQAFEDLKLVEILDNGAIFMNDIQNFIGKSSTHAERQKEYRRRIANEKEQTTTEKEIVKNNLNKLKNESENKCVTNVKQELNKNEPEKEKELEIEKELQQETEPSGQLSLSSLFEFWECNGFGMLAPKTRQDLSYWVKDFQELGANEQEALELIQEALKLAINANARRYNYVNGILKNWEAKRYTNVKQVNADRKASAGIRKDMTDRQREDAEKVEREAMENPNSIYNAF
ncbi:phage replisome organizer N-terminal domain-containing protein [Enterococcus cecorum]|uniref:phage replisome organizer N-terminal domain-containing protein n=1 Tax=Enterococcus cecorum TaxID=44008 RepID=UPI001FACC356|nr:phage replisome organizer N-terminal domain-containing protein [Enterococcus cecorum]MCJ0571689.1 phage replisome organizer N-terminal domain-containing protein [Enterococcus cecorum]MCJ0589874.1 phage replisome organizer N-terminal domain-containing protein [Enterococcus cecorum]